MSDMRFGTGLSNAADARAAVEEAAGQALGALGPGDGPVDLAVFFTTPHHATAEAGLGRLVRERTGARALAGATAQAVIGGGRESEAGPGLSVFLARLPGVEVLTFTLPPQEEPDPPLEEWAAAIPASGAPDARETMLLVCDPFTIDVVKLFDMTNDRYPRMPIVGGMASGGFRPGMNRLYSQDEAFEAAATGLVLSGPVEVRAIVSQGCRPIGKHMVITKARGNVIQQIGGKPALAALKDVIASLDPRDQGLAQRALHVGRVVDERRDSFGRGDFLIRNLIGVDPESGAIAVADSFRGGQTIQLHVRDALAAGEELKHLLEPARDGSGGMRRSALLFSCNGRGRRFFGIADHDSNAIRDALGDVAIGGFFCGGEFGPIGGKTFVHGFTSSIALLGPAAARS